MIIDHRAVPDPKFDWTEIPEALRLLDDGGVSAISSYIFIDGVSPHARTHARMYACVSGLALGCDGRKAVGGVSQ